MGMRIGGNGTTATASATAAMQQRQQGLKTLFGALKSGDLNAAQQAYASLTSGKTAPDANSPLGQIGAALQKGDLASAQSLAQQTAQAQHTHGAHGHHHHPAGDTAQVGAGDPAASGATTAAATATAAVGKATGSLIDLIA